MKAQLSEKRGMFSKLGGSSRKLSLRERRMQASSDLTLSVNRESEKPEHPVQKLKRGDYDVRTDHLLFVTEDGAADETLENSISAFLE